MGNRRIGILTAGGDCPGLNVAVAAAKDAVSEAGARSILLRDGYASLVRAADSRNWRQAQEQHAIEERHIDWRLSVRAGGSVLGSSRTNLGREDLYRKAMEGVGRLRLDGIVIIGGDGSLTSAARLARDGLTVGAAPKTIDNDVAASETALGFATAVQTATDALDRISDTATTHGTSFLIEVMGRRSGQLAAATAQAGPCDGVCVPEAAYSADDLKARLRPEGTVIVQAESAWPDELRSSGKTPVGGVAEATARLLEQSGSVRHVTLGHVLRGGSPVAADRTLGRELGTLAGSAATERGGLAVVLDGRTRLISLKDAPTGRRHLDQDQLDSLGRLLVRRA